MQLPIFRIISGVTIEVQRHSKENIFVITSGIENAVTLARVESLAKSQDRDVWVGLSPSLEETDSLVEG